MALRPSALGCTHIAADTWFTGEGRTRWENRESNSILLLGSSEDKRKQWRTAEAAVPHGYCRVLLSAKLLEEQADGFDSVMEVGNMELLVRSVEIVVG